MSVDSKYGMQVRQDKWPEKGLFKFGYNSTISTSMSTVWSGGGLYSYPTSASAMGVSSEDDADVSVVTIDGLDENYNRVSETVTLNGQTPVFTTASFIRVFRGTVDSVEPAGDIWVGTGTVTGGTPANKYAHISVGENQTLMAVWTVPAGYTAYILSCTVSTGTEASNKYLTARLKVRPFGGVPQTKEVFSLARQSVQSYMHFPTVVSEKSDIEICAITSSGTDAVSATFALVYVKN